MGKNIHPTTTSTSASSCRVRPPDALYGHGTTTPLLSGKEKETPSKSFVRPHSVTALLATYNAATSSAHDHSPSSSPSATPAVVGTGTTPLLDPLRATQPSPSTSQPRPLNLSCRRGRRTKLIPSSTSSAAAAGAAALPPMAPPAVGSDSYTARRSPIAFVSPPSFPRCQTSKTSPPHTHHLSFSSSSPPSFSFFSSSSSSSSPPPSTTSCQLVALANGSHSIRITAPSAELLLPSSLHILTRISEGGFGRVYQALHQNKLHAIKISTPIPMSPYAGGAKDRMLSNEQMQNFVREVNAYSSLRHSNILQYVGACVEPRFLALVLEYLPNGNVSELLHKRSSLPTASLRLRLASQLVDVVAYLHGRQVIHGDLKPANFMLDDQFNLKLCDFGKTRKLKPGETHLKSNFGSPRYMAPECFFRHAPVNDRADIWSLACCLIEIFGGPIPYASCKSQKEVKAEIFTKGKKPEIPKTFIPVLRRVLPKCFDMCGDKRPSIAVLTAAVRTVTVDDIVHLGKDPKLPRQA